MNYIRSIYKNRKKGEYMSLIITRHGQTDWNLEHKLQGSSDIELNQIRARQTAEIINRNRNIPIKYDSGISERDYGEYEGKNSFDYNLSDFWNYYSNSKYQNVENIKDFFKRVYDFLDRQAIE